MNTHALSITLASLASFLVGTVSAEMEPQPQISFTHGASSTWNADWDGVDGRTYFVEWSLDLVNWHLAPIMKFGSGLQGCGVETADAPGLFVRLFYCDDPTVHSLEQAMNADFDHDGVSNYDEITKLGTNPFLYSTNGSGVADGAQDWDGDGISNADEIALGLDPGTDNSGPSSGAETVEYNYDDANRMTGVTSPASTESFTPDAEGNLE